MSGKSPIVYRVPREIEATLLKTMRRSTRTARGICMNMLSLV